MAEVRIDSVTKNFGAFKALDQVSIRFHEGGFYALLGPSGSGKTTILRLIAGFEEVDMGSIYINDVEVAGIPVEKRKIGMVFQNYALYPHMTVFENMAFGLRLRRYPKKEITKRVYEASEILNIKRLINQLVF